jgi:hypothetical protein
MTRRSLVFVGELAALMAGLVMANMLAGARREEQIAADAAAKKRPN